MWTDIGTSDTYNNNKEKWKWESYIKPKNEKKGNLKKETWFYDCMGEDSERSRVICILREPWIYTRYGTQP